jgi:hypothetical protein
VGPLAEAIRRAEEVRDAALSEINEDTHKGDKKSPGRGYRPGLRDKALGALRQIAAQRGRRI